MVTKQYVHLGIAVAGQRGLVVPNVKEAQDLTLRELTAALADLTGHGPRRPHRAGGPARRDDHGHQRRRLRRRRRRAHPQSG